MLNVVIETSGCSYNESDSETLSGLLEMQGHRVVSSTDNADVVVLNTCTVKDGSYRSFSKRLDALSEEGRRVVVAGCIPTAHPGLSKWEGKVVVWVNNLTDIALAVERAANEKEGAFLNGRPNTHRLDLPSRPSKSIVEVVPINQGRLSNCSFCETKLARGRLISYPVGSRRHWIEVSRRSG